MRFQRLTLNKIYLIIKEDDNAWPETEEIVFASFDKDKAEAKLEELRAPYNRGFLSWGISFKLEVFDVS